MLDAILILWAIGLTAMFVIDDLAKKNYFDKFSVKVDNYIEAFMLTFAVGTVLLGTIGFTYWLIGVNK